jgi:hypothetical protein
MVVGASWWSGLLLGLGLGLALPFFDFKGVLSVTGRADGGIVGAQASGGARALRHFVSFTARKRSVTLANGFSGRGIAAVCAAR